MHEFSALLPVTYTKPGAHCPDKTIRCHEVCRILSDDTPAVILIIDIRIVSDECNL